MEPESGLPLQAPEIAGKAPSSAVRSEHLPEEPSDPETSAAGITVPDMGLRPADMAAPDGDLLPATVITIDRLSSRKCWTRVG